MMTISDQIRRAIRQSGMSNYAIAKASAVTESTLSRFMAGEGISIDNIDRLAPVLGLRIVTGRKAGAKRTTRQATGKRGQRATKGR